MRTRPKTHDIHDPLGRSITSRRYAAIAFDMGAISKAQHFASQAAEAEAIVKSADLIAFYVDRGGLPLLQASLEDLPALSEGRRQFDEHNAEQRRTWVTQETEAGA